MNNEERKAVLDSAVARDKELSEAVEHFGRKRDEWAADLDMHRWEVTNCPKNPGRLTEKEFALALGVNVATIARSCSTYVEVHGGNPPCTNPLHGGRELTVDERPTPEAIKAARLRANVGDRTAAVAEALAHELGGSAATIARSPALADVREKTQTVADIAAANEGLSDPERRHYAKAAAEAAAKARADKKRRAYVRHELWNIWGHVNPSAPGVFIAERDVPNSEVTEIIDAALERAEREGRELDEAVELELAKSRKTWDAHRLMNKDRAGDLELAAAFVKGMSTMVRQGNENLRLLARMNASPTFRDAVHANTLMAIESMLRDLQTMTNTLATAYETGDEILDETARAADMARLDDELAELVAAEAEAGGGESS